MKRLFFCLLAALVLLSCGNPKDEQKVLTLMTYNVGSFSKYEDSSVEGVAGVIRRTGATLVSLNELDSCNLRHNTYQLKDIADAMGGWSFQFATALKYKGGSYGNGVISSERPVARYTISLPKSDGSEPRSAAVLETEDCVFAAVHLDHKSAAAQRVQMETINNWFSKVYGGSKKPVFLCGDFNAEPDSELISFVKENWTRLSGEYNTYSTDNPRKCIDYIFAFKDAAKVQLLSSRVLTSGTETISDHFPVEVKVIL